jgi:hypothetical protein
MSAIYVPIVVALIAGPLMWLLNRFDKRNTDQHSHNMRVLNEIKDDVREVRSDLKNHIDWHLKD